MLRACRKERELRNAREAAEELATIINEEEESGDEEEDGDVSEIERA